MSSWDELEKEFGAPAQPQANSAQPVNKWDALEQEFAAPKQAANELPSGGKAAFPSALLPKNAQPLTRTDRFKQGLVDPINAGAQLLTRALPSSVVSAGNEINNWLADKTGMVGRIPEGGIDQQIRQNESQYQARRTAGGESGLDAYRLGGNVFNPVNLAIAAKLPVAAAGAGLFPKIAAGAAGGSLSSLFMPATEGNPDDFWQEKAKQAALGAVVGGAIPAVAAGVRSVINPAAASNKNLQILAQEGVKPTIGQTLGGAWNRTEEKLQSIPILGDMITSARGAANRQFETAAHNRALSPIGMELPKGMTGRDAVNFTEKELRKNYDNVLNRIGAVTTDQTFNTNVLNLRNMVNSAFIPVPAKERFGMVIDDMSSRMNGNTLTSDAYKALESKLTTTAKTLLRSQNIDENEIGLAVSQLKNELQSMLQRQAGQNSSDLAATNLGWANFKRVQDAAGKIGAEQGEFSPAQFQNAVKKLDKSKDGSAFARGSALAQDLGDAGAVVLKGKVADSGTVGRAALGLGTLGGSFAVNPAIPAALVGGAAAYTPFMQNLLRASVMNRPQIAQPIGNAVEQIAPASIPYFAGLLNQYAK